MTLHGGMDRCELHGLLAFPLAIIALTTVGVDTARTIGAPAVWRPDEDGVQNAVLLVNPSLQVVEAGHLVGWHLFTARGRRSMTVFLQVWRPVDKRRRAYRLVGETKIAALWVGHSFFPMRPEDRIWVERGDTIGIYFPQFNAIPWSPVKCGHHNEHLFKYNPKRLLASGRTIRFDLPADDWKPCRNYSFNATIMSTWEMNQWDNDYEDVAVPRYLRRPYGNFIPTERPSSNSPMLLFNPIAGLHPYTCSLMQSISLYLLIFSA